MSLYVEYHNEKEDVYLTFDGDRPEVVEIDDEPADDDGEERESC